MGSIQSIYRNLLQQLPKARDLRNLEVVKNSSSSYFNNHDLLDKLTSDNFQDHFPTPRSLSDYLQRTTSLEMPTKMVHLAFGGLK